MVPTVILFLTVLQAAKAAERQCTTSPNGKVSDPDSVAMLQGTVIVGDALSNYEEDTSLSGSDIESPLPWDQSKFLGSDGSHQCDWRAIKETGFGNFLGGGPVPKMCLRSYTDLLSDAVKKAGVWTDCPALASWWTFLQDRRGGGHAKSFVDIGANLGACLLPMMARPDVDNALAFEPNPENLFYLTSSILANTRTKEKVKLYPFALGDENALKPIYVEEGNPGNTVVGRAITAQAVGVSKSGEVPTFKLDDIVMKGGTPPYIHLMKIDAQGYEVKILQGARKLFASGAVNAVKFELATTWLVQQGTSSAEYMNYFLQYGYTIYHTETKQPLSQAALHDVACGPPVIQDFVAAHPKDTEVIQDFVAPRPNDAVVLQKQISC